MISKRSEKAEIKDEDSEESESRVSEETEVCIIEMTEKIRKQNVNKLIKNKFSDDDINFFSTAFFSESRNSEKMREITIIMTLKYSV